VTDAGDVGVDAGRRRVFVAERDWAGRHARFAFFERLAED